MKIELEKKYIEEIVEIIAETLEIEEFGLEEKDILEKIVCLSIAVYLSKLNPENNSTGVH